MRIRRYSLPLFLGSLCLALAWQSDLRQEPLSEEVLGERLFHDSILSENYTLSCATCHRPEYAFADTSALSPGVHGRLGNRNTPSAMNLADAEILFWDGRAKTLEQQALMPIENAVEMNLSIDSAVARLKAHPFYASAFQQVYGQAPSGELLGAALAAFQRTLETGSPYDSYRAGREDAISESAKRGLVIFNEKGRCFDCHFGPDLTGDELRSIGTFDNIHFTDAGRFLITKDSADLGKFKTPGLRNVAITGPYMHDGSFATLREVIEYYNEPDRFRPHGINRDTLLRQPLGLNEQELEDLENFLVSLTSNKFQAVLQERYYGQQKPAKAAPKKLD